ncbi:uncharacterized protein LOC107998826 isoform X2 [Apis cerana]|uniref:uncharacterized protein LOC107998826 isoform X2 n=1 Tax=Apis cerana TaxID=7461 RepID=UPI0007E2B974|nr:uncharacterized protein LOC107998826 isoform X2 [Apis cerana]
MALSIALPLSGLEPEHFASIGARILYERGLRILSGNPPISPSTASESSGISSLIPSTTESSTPNETPISSRPETPAEETIKKEEGQTKEEELPLRIYYRQRDILNLGANLREPFWQMRVPTMPRYDFKSFVENRSVYYRLGEFGLTEDYPTRMCTDCGFCEPSPYLF